MNLNNYKWPEVNRVDVVFPTFRAPKELLEEAKKRGYYNGDLRGNKLFSQLFFNGGKIKLKKNLSDGLLKAWSWCRVFMGSWEPKHEEKEAIAGMIIDEVIENIT